MQFPEIHFGGNNPKLHSYKKFKWNPGETRIIEFYPNINTTVTLLYSSDPSLFEKLSTLIDGHPISIDLEWAQPWNHSPHPIELFQFSSSKGTIIVATDQNKGYDQISKFLHSSPFFGKGMSSDKKKLRECCGENFDYIEDIEQTRLLPNNLSINFEAVTLMFLGPGTAKFKDHKVQKSNWSVRPLSMLQILYGAHDSYAMLEVYKKIIEKYGPEIKKVPIKSKSDKNKKKDKIKFNIICHFIDLDKFFIEKNMSVDFNLSDIENEAELFDEKKPSLKELLFNHEKKKSNDVNDIDSCFINHADHVLPFLLPTQPKDKRFMSLERICLAGDLLLLGIMHAQKKGNSFVCQVCQKSLHDPVAMISHSESRHCNDLSINHNLDLKDVFLHYLAGTDQVKCPFEVIFESSQLKNLEVEEEDDEDEDESSNDEENYIDLLNNAIVPKTYNESDGIKCCICNHDFNSVEELRDHCWLNHYELFVKLVTLKGFEKEREKEDKKLIRFGMFCIKQLNLASINHDNLIINCNLCKFAIANPAKFFMHAIFKHKGFAIVKKEQYKKWPINYSEFNETILKQIKKMDVEIEFNELVENHIYDPNENKCIDCGISFNDDDEREEHYLIHHLIYLPSDFQPLQ